MKKTIAILLVSMTLTFSPAKAKAGGFWDGIKEAAHGVGWMFYMEACKLTWALFSEEGLNIGNLKYYCIHPQHDILHKPNRKRCKNITASFVTYFGKSSSIFRVVQIGIRV